uniref:Uncharacterized protein n=1 Tax=Ascaris lumbricoides TaxID=6252 RepID=A0A0M3HF52_ASCLU
MPQWSPRRDTNILSLHYLSLHIALKDLPFKIRELPALHLPSTILDSDNTTPPFGDSWGRSRGADCTVILDLRNHKTLHPPPSTAPPRLNFGSFNPPE